MSHLLAPSLLAADFGNLQKEIEMVNESQADWIHCDIMDGVFVPNISFGIPVLKDIKKYAKKPLDVHLMIVNPDHLIPAFRDAGADILTVHLETCPHLHRTLQIIREHGMKPSVVINPHTPVHLLEDILPEVYMVLVMSVNPGFGGQQFIENTYQKVKALRKMINGMGLQTLIEVDGGVDETNAGKLYESGVDVLVAGTTVFKAKDPVKMIELLKSA